MIWRQVGVLLTGEVGSRILAVVLTSLIAHQCGLGVLAAITVGQSIFAYASVVGDAGLSAYGVRRLVKNDAPVAEVVREVTSTQVFISAGISLLLLPYAWHVTGPVVALCLVFIPIFFGAAPTYALQAAGRMRAIATGRVMTNLVSLCVGATVSFTTGDHIVAVAYPIGAFANVAYTARSLMRSGASYLRALTWRINGRWLRASGWLYAQTVLVHALSSTPLLVAAATFRGMESDLFAVAVRLQILGLIPSSMLQTVLLPHFVTQRRGLAKVLMITVAAAAVMTVGLWPLAGWLLTILYGGEAASAVGYLRLLSLQFPAAYAAAIMTSALTGMGAYQFSAFAYLVAVIIEGSLCCIAARAHSISIIALSVSISEAALTLSLFVTLVVFRRRQARHA